MGFKLFQLAATLETGHTALVQRTIDHRYFNPVTGLWQLIVDDQCHIPLAELDPVEKPGRYSAELAVELADDSYTLYDFREGQELENVCTVNHKTTDNTLFEMVNLVRRQLRFPQVTDLTDAHSQFLVNMINVVQREMVGERFVWPELRHGGFFKTLAGHRNYPLNFLNLLEIDFILGVVNRTTYPGYELVKTSSNNPVDFYKEFDPKPLAYSTAQMSGELSYINLFPAPSLDDLTIFVNVHRKPAVLDDPNMTPDLPSDVIMMGTYAYALEEQGNDYRAAREIYENKLMSWGDHHGDRFMSDYEMSPV